VFALEGLNSQAEQDRERLAAHLAKTDRLASRFEAKRAAATANEASATG
jgi:hypothetical protein